MLVVGDALYRYCTYLSEERTVMPNQYWIPRVRLMFCAEDPSNFARRVAKAYRDRKHTEALLRYNLYVDCMPMEGVGELDTECLKRMSDWAKGAPALAKDKRCVPNYDRPVLFKLHYTSLLFTNHAMFLLNQNVLHWASFLFNHCAMFLIQNLTFFSVWMISFIP